MPALFIHGRQDTIVSISHSQKLFSVYPGHSKIHEIETEHNDPRPKFIKNEIKNFFIHKFAEVRKKREFNDTINSVLEEKLTNNKGNHRLLEDFLNKMTYHESDDSPHGSPPPKEQTGLNLGSLKGSYENPSPMTDRSSKGEPQVSTASIEAIVGNKLFMMMKTEAAQKKKNKKKYEDESDSDEELPYFKNKDRTEPKFVPFGKGAQALFDLKFKNGGSLHRRPRNDSFNEPKGYQKKVTAYEYHSDGEM